MHEAEYPRGPLIALIAAQDGAGGWGWRPQQPANTECTALAVLALHAYRSESDAAAAVKRGASWLRSRQHADGSWPMGDQVPESSWMTCLAVLALATINSDDGDAIRGASWLVGRRSRAHSWVDRALIRLFPSLRVVEQDLTLVGWPWTTSTAAWVEPTAWSLLAIKQLKPHLDPGSAGERIRHAELLLADRMCYGGGWNFGTKMISGEALPPYPDTTALGLIALQDARLFAVTDVSIERLKQLLVTNRSALVLALSVLSLQLHGHQVSELREELRQRIRMKPVAETRTLALALLALDEDELHFQAKRNA